MSPTVDRDLVVGLTQDLIRFPSVNPPGDEEEIARFLASRMRDLGIEAELQPVADKRANVIGRVRGRGDGHLVYTGHLDVVPPGGQAWQHPAFDGSQIDGRIYGRGSCDMKGGVAAVVAAAAALVQAGFRPRADLILACTAGEEAGMIGAQRMVERRSLEGARYLVVAEPSDLDVFIGEKGVLWVRVRALGRTAHGSMPWLGVNAVSFMSRLIPRLEEYPFTWEASALLGDPTLSVNVIRGGNKTNVIPDFCEIELDMRTVPSQKHEDILEQIRAIAVEESERFHDQLRVEVELDEEKQPVETDRGHALVQAAESAAHAVLGRNPDVCGVTFATDAAYLGPGFGIPMVICGPGAPGMAHQPDEYVEIDQLVHAAQIYVDLTQRLLG